MRTLVLIIALLFIAMLTALTVDDFVNNGFTALGVLSVMIIVLFLVGIVGALRHRPPE
jgi:hypothetical protein